MPAANIRGQAVTDHGRFFNAKIRDSGKTGVKERLGRLIGPDFLGNENALKIFADAGVIQTGILHRCRAVGGQIQTIFGGQLTQKLLCVGHKGVLLGEKVLVPLAQVAPRIRDVHFPEQLLKALHQNLITGEAALLQ